MFQTIPRPNVTCNEILENAWLDEALFLIILERVKPGPWMKFVRETGQLLIEESSNVRA
jgi:hypothetical protein